MYCGFITKVSEIKPHNNADKLEIAVVLDTPVIVSKDELHVGDLVLYFPIGGQLSEDYCKANKMLRMDGGYLDNEKRNIKPLKLRGEVSEGIIMPLSSLDYLGKGIDFSAGTEITVVKGKEVCKKYIPKHNSEELVVTKNQKKKPKRIEKEIFVFPEHIDTAQLKFYKDNFKIGDLVTITEKLEGTSHRSALLKTTIKNGWFRNLLHLPEKVVYKDYCGTRRVTVTDKKGGFYGENSFRLDVHKQIALHLSKGMEVFAEIVGWPAKGLAPLMGTVKTAEAGKDFENKYGKEMTFSYGCAEGTYDFYIYRICELDDDGDVRVEYSTDQIMNWCKRYGFKYVPLLYRGFLTRENEIVELAQKYNDGESTLGFNWREGCVIRRENNAAKFDVYKDKNFIYKLLKGKAIDEMAAEGKLDNMSEDIVEEL